MTRMERVQLSEGDAVPVDAGPFPEWIDGMRAAIRGERDADVPCGDCTACCTSSQFIHIEPEETATLRRIPKELLFPAPRYPAGHVLLGFTKRGHCPMFVDNACSIYDDRPKTCRTYDCRIFTATGVDAGDDGRDDISRRTRAWDFTYGATTADVATADAMRAAAEYIRAQRSSLPPDLVPATATQLAVLAFEVHQLFITDNADAPTITAPEIDDLIAALAACRIRGRTGASADE